MEVVASLFQGRTAAAQCGLFTHKSVPVVFEPPCIMADIVQIVTHIELCCRFEIIVVTGYCASTLNTFATQCVSFDSHSTQLLFLSTI